MSVLGNVDIKVEPSVLKNQAKEVETLGHIIRSAFSHIEFVINATKDHWIGDAGDLHREMYNKRKGEIEEALQRLKDHPTNLMRIAGVYEEAENDNEGDAQSLRENIIEG